MAVSSIKDSLQLLAAGKDREAFFASKKAVISSGTKLKYLFFLKSNFIYLVIDKV